LQARRKIIWGAELRNKSLQEDSSPLQAKESEKIQRTPKSDDGEPIDDGAGMDLDANSNHQQETPKEPSPAAAISPTNSHDLGDMNYDTSFDSPHFDLMGPSFSPRYTLAEVHWDSMNHLSPNNVAVRSSFSLNDMNWPIPQSPCAVAANEEGHEVSNLQRSMHVRSIPNSPKVHPITPSDQSIFGNESNDHSATTRPPWTRF
jgi:hypothetical protein